MSVFCDQCTQTPELLEPNAVEEIWLCPNHGVIENARKNVPCSRCGRNSTKRPFDAFAPSLVFECLRCKVIVYEAPIEHSAHVKGLLEEKKSGSKLPTTSVPKQAAVATSKADIPCMHGSGCWSVAKGTCPYKHEKRDIPCNHGTKCWSKGTCPYKH